MVMKLIKTVTRASSVTVSIVDKGGDSIISWSVITRTADRA
jgi:hypothetical protein